MMVDYIDQHRQEFGVESICNELPIAPSTYHDFKQRQPSARAQRDAAMLPILDHDVLVTRRGYDPAQKRVARSEPKATVTLVPRIVHVLMGKQGEPLAHVLLKGDDGSVRELTRRDARPFDDEHMIVEFREVLDGVRYSLYQVVAPDMHLPFFEDVHEQNLPRSKAVELG